MKPKLSISEKDVLDAIDNHNADFKHPDAIAIREYLKVKLFLDGDPDIKTIFNALKRLTKQDLIVYDFKRKGYQIK